MQKPPHQSQGLLERSSWEASAPEPRVRRAGAGAPLPPWAWGSRGEGSLGPAQCARVALAGNPHVNVLHLFWLPAGTNSLCAFVFLTALERL